MSRIGKKPISVPAGVSVALDPSQRKIDVSGPKGSLSLTHRPEVTVAWDEDEKQVSCTVAEGKANDGQTKAYWGLTRSLINNMIEGVTKGMGLMKTWISWRRSNTGCRRREVLGWGSIG